MSNTNNNTLTSSTSEYHNTQEVNNLQPIFLVGGNRVVCPITVTRQQLQSEDVIKYDIVRRRLNGEEETVEMKIRLNKSYTNGTYLEIHNVGNEITNNKLDSITFEIRII